MTEWTWNTARHFGVLPQAWLCLAYADLREADLREADLTDANLTRANLTGANLTGANLTRANLMGANLTRADLTDADLDFSCWPLWCGSLNVKVDIRLAAHLAYHFCALVCDDPEYISARNAVLEFANKMHRDDVPRLERKDT